jgi:hypothetical protein
MAWSSHATERKRLLFQHLLSITYPCKMNGFMLPQQAQVHVSRLDLPLQCGCSPACHLPLMPWHSHQRHAAVGAPTNCERTDVCSSCASEVEFNSYNYMARNAPPCRQPPSLGYRAPCSSQPPAAAAGQQRRACKSSKAVQHQWGAENCHVVCDTHNS